MLLIKETRKIFINNKIWVLCLIFVLLYPLVYNYSIGKQPEFYSSSYFQKTSNFLSGPLNTEKEDFINQEYRNLLTSQNMIDETIDLYRNGSINDEIFKKNIDQANKVIEKENEIEYFYKQYQYVVENPSQRYFVKTHQWDKVFFNELDYSLIIFLILISTYIFGIEFLNNFNIVLLTTINGRKKIFIAKLSIAITTSVLIGTYTLLVKYLFADIFNLSEWSFPIQSINGFSSIAKGSISTYYILQVIFFVLGVLLITFLSIFIILYFHKFFHSLLITLCIIILPNFIFHNTSLLTFTPTSLLSAGDLLSNLKFEIVFTIFFATMILNALLIFLSKKLYNRFGKI